jgi:hypothetical protein
MGARSLVPKLAFSEPGKSTSAGEHVSPLNQHLSPFIVHLYLMPLNQPLYTAGIMLAALGLARIPVVGRWLRVLNTMVHETGHAMAALLTSGEVLRIDLKSDTSGQALTKSPHAWSRFWVAWCGYPFADSIGLCCCYLTARGHAPWVLYGLSACLLLNLVFWVRNAFGLLWILTVGSGMVAALWYLPEEGLYYTSLACSALLVMESVVASTYLVGIAFKTPEKAGDATLLRNQTHVPAWFWALTWWFITMLCVYLALSCFFPLPAWWD